jgi:hypothetical protein
VRSASCDQLGKLFTFWSSYSVLLLLVVLSAYSEGPQYAKPPDPLDSTLVTVYLNSSSAQLGVLAPVLPQNEVYKIALPQHEVYMFTQPQNELFHHHKTEIGLIF